MAKTIAAQIVAALVRAGVKRIHGLTGDSLNEIMDEVRKTEGKIEFIHYRNEEAAAFGAGAEAQITGRLAVCAGSCGPGNLHLINGLFDAHRSMAPVLAIAAHIPSGEIGTGYFQETHPDRLFQECSSYCELISRPGQMPRVLQAAMQHAVSQSGVAVIAISGDVAMEEVGDAGLTHDIFRPEPVLTPNLTELAQLAQILGAAKKITILAGSGCRGAREEVIELCRILQAPVVTALRGKDVLEADNPYHIGLSGLIGFPCAHNAIMETDLLVMLGTDFPYKDWYPKDAKIVQIDIRPERLGRRCRLDLGLVGNIKDTLLLLLPLLEARPEPCEHLSQYRREYEHFMKRIQPTVEEGSGDLIHPQLLAHLLSDASAPDAVYTTDVGTPTVWAARNIHMKKGQRLLGSFNHGSMASAMPQAIGVAVSAPGRQVIALCGDGGFAMLMGEILTIAQYKLPVKLVIFNNSSLGFVEMEQKVGGIPPFGVELKNPNFAALAQACGIAGKRVERKQDLAEAIDIFLKFDGPALLDVVVNTHELSMPPQIKLEQAWGFSMYMLKDTVRGRGLDVWETMRTNFLS